VSFEDQDSPVGPPSVPLSETRPPAAPLNTP
jgi:hypothetical protein